MNKLVIGIMFSVGLFADNFQAIGNDKIKTALEQESKKNGCDKLNRLNDESDTNFSERIRKCMIMSFLNSTNEILLETKDSLPMQLIKSTEKSNLKCPSGYITTGSCGDWKCSKELVSLGNQPAFSNEDHSMFEGAKKIMFFWR